MKVFRIETAIGTGPFITELDFDDAMRTGAQMYCLRSGMYTNPYNQPEPYKDVPGNWNGMHFGFKSIAQLLEWFPSPSGRRAMSKYFSVSIFNAQSPHYIVGGHQIAFRRDQAEFIEHLPIDTIHLEHEEELYETA